MNSHNLIYKPLNSKSPYEDYIIRMKQNELKEKKELFYHEIIKFNSSRYPKGIIEKLHNEVNPFNHSLEQMKQIISSAYPHYPKDIINESIQYVFNKKSREAVLMKESMYIIEDGDQFIRNRRKLKKEDFTFQFSNIESRNQSQSKIKSPTLNKHQISLNKSSSASPSLIPIKMKEQDETSRILDLENKNQIFNELIAEEIIKEKIKYQQFGQIYEGDPEDITEEDIMKKQIGFTSRSRTNLNTSFPLFKEKDVLVQPDEGIETCRSEMEELNFLLAEVTILGEEKGSTSRRSRGNNYNVVIKKQNMDNLYNAQGNLKIDVLKRAVGRLKNIELSSS